MKTLRALLGYLGTGLTLTVLSAGMLIPLGAMHVAAPEAVTTSCAPGLCLNAAGPNAFNLTINGTPTITSDANGAVNVSAIVTPFLVTRNLTGAGGNAMLLQRDNGYNGGVPTNNDTVGFLWRLKDSANNYSSVAGAKGMILDVTAGTSVKGALGLYTRTTGDSSEVERFRIDDTGSVSLAGVGSMELALSTATPTIASGFGGSPTIAGRVYAFRVTLSTSPGTTGTVTFNTTFQQIPVVQCVDETTVATAVIKTAPTATNVVITYAGVNASDKLACTVLGY